jgi:NAD-dependent SIR2 family protein deacetylase
MERKEYKKLFTKLSGQQIYEYALWVLDECDSPVDEIEWLAELIMKSNKNEEFTENITELLTNKTK